MSISDPLRAAAAQLRERRRLMPGGTIAIAEILKTPSFRDTVDQKARRELHTAIMAVLMDYCNTYNVVRNMTAQQLATYAVHVLNHYSDLRLEDVFLVFQKAKAGEYGELFDRIDQGVLDGYFRAYLIERNAEKDRHLQSLKDAAYAERLQSGEIRDRSTELRQIAEGILDRSTKAQREKSAAAREASFDRLRESEAFKGTPMEYAMRNLRSADRQTILNADSKAAEAVNFNDSQENDSLPQ